MRNASLSNWLAYILSESDHRKYTVQGWVDAVVDGKQPLQPIWNDEILLGAGYENGSPAKIVKCSIST